jgi:post-segregation antitoxin (ccd killing protein)
MRERRYTERIRFTVPKGMKDEWRQKAKQRGISMSALIREIIDDLIAWGEFEVWMAERELSQGATVQ